MKRLLKNFLAISYIRNVASYFIYIFYNTVRRNGTNNTIEKKDSFLIKNKIKFIGNHNKISLGKNVRISNFRIFINGNKNSIIIDDNCRLKSGVLWIEDESNMIKIGNGTTIEQAGISATGFKNVISIGDDCMLSSSIDIRNGDSHSVIDLFSKIRINYEKSIFIGNHVWIGMSCTILKGTKIPNNSIVGTRSLVANEFDEENTIIAGNPAKVIKKNVNWLRKRI